jgi:hypothetical protein
MKLYLLIFLLSFQLFAAKVSVILNDTEFKKAPPSDLIYDNSPIDSSEAFDLIQNGVALENLNPVNTELWQDTKHDIHNYSELNYPTNNPVFNFHKYKASPTEIFRAQVENQGNFYNLVASLDNHTNIIRATLLRLLGYKIDTPKIYKNLKVKFDSNEQRDKFLELLGEGTLTNREKWVKEKNDHELVLKDIIIEPAELSNVNIYLPLMTSSRQKERRVFRSLLEVYILTDFPQAVNAIQWRRGRIFNGSLIFNHPYADKFNNVMVQDLKWIHQRINQLSRSEIEKAVSLAGYPYDIEKLIVEKLLSRINYFSELLSLEQVFSFDRNISIGAIINGELKTNNYNDDYVVDYTIDDEESPYSFRQIFRLFRTQTVYTTLASLLDMAVEKFVPGLKMEDALQQMNEDITSYRQNLPQTDTPQKLPIKVFAQPILNGRVYANRNIIFGQYLGSNAPIQLVDSVGAEILLGGFGNIINLQNNIVPTIGANITLNRTYTHVRAMPDLEAATSQEVKKILVPRHLKRLGRVIKDEFSCTIPEGVYTEKEEIDGRVITFIRYDEKLENGIELARQKREELIAAGEEGPFLIKVIDREEECVTEVSETRKKNLKDFLDQLALNETFVINDSIRVMMNQRVPIPLTSVAPNLSLSLGADQSVALIRSVVIRKKEEGIEVTFQSQRDLQHSLSQRLSYFIELIGNNTQWTKGKMYSKVYKIDLEGIDSEEQEKALFALRAIFTQNDHYLLKEQYEPTELDHDVRVRLNTFNILFFKSERLKMNHEVEIRIPNKEGQDFSLEERTRRLYGVSNFKRKGNDFYSFVDRIISGFTSIFGLGQSNQDPGKSFYGSSKKRYVRTEGELTENYPLNPISRVEIAWTGWNKKVRKMYKVFDEVEEFFTGIAQSETIDDTILEGATKVKSYDVKTSFIIYPEALDSLSVKLFDVKELSAINYLYFAYGEEEWQRYCERAIEFFGERGPQDYYGEDDRYYNCIPPDVKDILEFRRKGLGETRKEILASMNKIIETLFNDFKINKVLRLLGTDNFFATTRVNGFRENHHQGYLDYISNSVGTYNVDYGTGTFDMIAQQLGISAFELRALMYTPGM